MADEKPSLHIDTDWKKQAQEEKRRLAEKAAKPPTAPAAPPVTGSGASAASVASPAGGRRARALPQASFTSLVQSIMTQVLYHLGDLASAGGGTNLDLDLAKHQIDTLNVLEEKTQNNLTPEDQRVLDAALYETRTRFVSVASQLLGP